MLAYVSGRIIPEAQGAVSINDRGWLYGDAVFETLRTYGGRVFKPAEHFARLRQSAGLVGIDLPLSYEGFTEAINGLLRAEGGDDDLMVRVTVSRGAGGAGIYPLETLAPTVVVQLRAIPDYPPRTFLVGWSLVIAKTRRNDPRAIDPLIKSTNFLNNVLAKKEAVEAGVNEALMLNQAGFVAESTVSNFFLVKDGRVMTPPLSDGILPGITRETVIDLARTGGIPVSETSLDAQAVYGCDEAFLTLTSAGIVPVVEVDSRQLGAGKPGPVVAGLRSLYDEHVEAWKRS